MPISNKVSDDPNRLIISANLKNIVARLANHKSIGTKERARQIIGRELGEATASYIKQIESGKASLRAEHILRLEKRFGFDRDDILGRRGEEDGRIRSLRKIQYVLKEKQKEESNSWEETHRFLVLLSNAMDLDVNEKEYDRFIEDLIDSVNEFIDGHK